MPLTIVLSMVKASIFLILGRFKMDIGHCDSLSNKEKFLPFTS